MKRLMLFAVLFMNLSLNAAINFISVKDLATWEEMLDLAHDANRNLLVYLEKQGCQTCKVIEKTTFDDKALSSWAKENILALSLDVGTEIGANVAQLYEISTYPTLVLINPGEIRFETITALDHADKVLVQLQAANKKATLYPEWKKQAATGDLDHLTYIDFILIEYQNNRIAIDHPVVHQLATTLDSTDFNVPAVLTFIQQMCVDVDGPIYKTLLNHPEWIEDSAQFNWDVYKKNVYEFNIARAVDQKDSILLEDVIYQISRLHKGENIANLAQRARLIYAAELGKWAVYDTLVLAYLADMPADSADLYQEEALFLMDNYSDAEANKLALKFIKRGLEKKETFQLYYTLSLWLYANNDLTNSYKAAFMAEKLAANTEEKSLARQIQTVIERGY